MTQTTELRPGAVVIRDEGDGRSMEGIAIVYGEESGNTAEYGSTPERFAPGAFRDALAEGKPVPFFSRHGGEMVGAVTFEDGPAALGYRGRLFDTPGALAFREQVRAGIDGASIEFAPGIVQQSKDRVVHRQVKRVVAIAGTHIPAYRSSNVAVREQDMIETTDTETPARSTDEQLEVRFRAIAGEQVTALRREWAERDTSTQTSEGDRQLLAARSLAELFTLIDGDRQYRHAYSRALADQITTNNPGVIPGGIGAVKGIVEQGRPAINAFGRVGLGGSGMTVDWPYFAGNLGVLVAEQLTQKAEITSIRVDLLKGTAPIKTFAGGSDISNQLLRRSDPAYLDAYLRIMFAAYAAVTEGQFVNEIEGTAGTGSITLTWASATADQIHGALALASTQVQDRTGNPASFGICGAGVFVTLMSKVLPVNAQNAIGSGTAASELNPVISGLRIYYSPAVNADRLIVSNGQTAAWHEDGPFQIDEEDVARLGRNVAVWGMGATAVYLPAAIIKVGPGAAVLAASAREK